LKKHERGIAVPREELGFLGCSSFPCLRIGRNQPKHKRKKNKETPKIKRQIKFRTHTHLSPLFSDPAMFLEFIPLLLNLSISSKLN